MQPQVTGGNQRRLAPITTRTFGRFRLERRIAYGGMAEILLATELRSNRLVVLKRILPQYSSNPEFVQYFIHEGRLGQRLTHPNLVETYEAGKVGETCYIALEWLRGGTCIDLLRAASKQGLELPLGAAVRIVADAARGLHYAHSAATADGQPLGVVHRDVTPHNLFLCRDGQTKVLDFGIAKAASQLHHTRTGTIKGKFSYLAPEQIRGEAIDRRVDVFALGIVLHELLTLKPLFRGVNDAETLQRILTLDVPPPERVRHTVPPGLGAVALRALQRDRDRRLPSAEALADSIEAVAEAECIDASHEVVASLLGELCPPSPEESLPDVPAPGFMDFGPEPPSVRSASRRSRSSPAVAAALGATSSSPRPKDPSRPGSGPLPLPPPPGGSDVAGPPLDLAAMLELEEEISQPEQVVVLEAPILLSQMKPLEVADTVPNRPEPSTHPKALPALAEPRPAGQPWPRSPSAPQLPVALGRESWLGPSLDSATSARGRAARLAAIVSVAVLGVGALLVRTSCRTVSPTTAAVSSTAPASVPAAAPAAPKPQAEPQAQILPPPAPPAPPPPEPPAALPPAPLAAEGMLRVQADSAASFTIDGRAERPSADGAFHLPPGHHKVVVSSPLLGGPRSFDVEVKHGETVTRAVHGGRGRLRVAVSPWAEVQVDGRALGTTPLSPVDLGEGTHWVVLKNGELGANVKKKVVVAPDKEVVLRVDLFAR